MSASFLGQKLASLLGQQVASLFGQHLASLVSEIQGFLSEVRVFWHWVDDLTGAAELCEAILKPFEAPKIKPNLGFTFRTRSCSPFGQGARFGVSFEPWGPCSLSIVLDPLKLLLGLQRYLAFKDTFKGMKGLRCF